LVTGFTATAHGFVAEVMVAVTDCAEAAMGIRLSQMRQRKPINA
jgi:hypothetical protein